MCDLTLHGLQLLILSQRYSLRLAEPPQMVHVILTVCSLMGLMRLILHIRHCHHKYKLSQPLLSDYDKCDESFVTFLPEQHAVHIHSTDLYESSQVAQLGLGSQSHVKEQSDVDGNHRHHVNNVQRVMEELLPVWCEQQPRDDLKEITNTQRLSLSSVFSVSISTDIFGPNI